MKDIYTNYLFNKHILVGNKNANALNNVLYLAKVFNIKIIKGKELTTVENVQTASKNIGVNIPKPFYKGFPDSVRQLSVFELFADQIIHYFNTYGLGDFSGEAGHSIFEKEIEPKLFNEKTQPKEFTVLTEEQAQEKILEIVKNLCASSRPLNEMDFNLLYEVLSADYSWIAITDDYEGMKKVNAVIEGIKSKDTIVRLLEKNRAENSDLVSRCAIKDEGFKLLNINDVWKFIKIWNLNPKKLHFNGGRKYFIKSFIENGLNQLEFRDCAAEMYEKKQDWKGLIHNLHYSHYWLQFLFEKKPSESVYSKVEKLILTDPVKAAEALKEGKGNGALLRKLNYLISRCSTKQQIKKILDMIESKNPIILIQLYIQYKHYNGEERRTFKYLYNNLQVTYTETDEEMNRRKSIIKKSWLPYIQEVIMEKLNTTLKNKVGKVYIDSEMDNIAIPLQNCTSNSGFGVLPSGSIIKLPKAKVFRLFTYWEKVNDIDLSSIGINKDGSVEEFSWRTFYHKQSKGITFSGDVTNGYNGGSEYIDVNIDEVKKLYPNMRYLVMCDNVFSGTGFDNCICKAGYMLRNKLSSGEIFEPKTVQTGFAITGHTNFNIMFALDIENNQIIWLNINQANSRIVAGTGSVSHIAKYFDLTDDFSIAKVFAKAAAAVVDDIKEATLIISDKKLKLGKNQEQVHSFDFEKVFKFLK